MDNIFLYIIFCVVFCGALIFITSRKTRTLVFALIVSITAVGGTLTGFLYTTESTRVIGLGNSSFITGNTDLCETALGKKSCIMRETYRGFPIPATRTTYPDDYITNTDLGTDKAKGGPGMGIIANFLIFVAVGYLIALCLPKSIRRKKVAS